MNSLCQEVKLILLIFAILVTRNVVNCMNLPLPKLPVTLESMIQEGLLVQPRENLYVLGTVHIGSKSAHEAELLIETVKPANVVVEIPPSRLIRIQKKASQIRKKEAEQSNDGINTSPTTEGGSLKEAGLLSTIGMFPALASEGYAKGGLSGMLFSTIIVWGSLLKRSTTVGEEADSLPRRNEFEAAVIASENVGANVIPADLEFEDLIQTVATSMTPLSWANLGFTVFCESIGLRESDPVRRGKGESMVEWELRRRNVETARASRAHGEISNPELSDVLVNVRDAEFAQICMDFLDGGPTVCVVGLVHLDGIVNLCGQQSTMTETMQ